MNRVIVLPNSLTDVVAMLSTNQVVPLTKALIAITWIIWIGRNDKLFQ